MSLRMELKSMVRTFVGEVKTTGMGGACSRNKTFLNSDCQVFAATETGYSRRHPQRALQHLMEAALWR